MSARGSRSSPNGFKRTITASYITYRSMIRNCTRVRVFTLRRTIIAAATGRLSKAIMLAFPHIIHTKIVCIRVVGFRELISTWSQSIFWRSSLIGCLVQTKKRTRKSVRSSLVSILTMQGWARSLIYLQRRTSTTSLLNSCVRKFRRRVTELTNPWTSRRSP